MPYRISVVEIYSYDPDHEKIPPISRYEQTVEEINLKAVMKVVNTAPRKPRQRKSESDK